MQKTDAGGRFFYFIFYFLINRCGTQVCCFISSKIDESCIYISCYTLQQCSMGGVLHVQPLMLFGSIQEPCWTLNQTIFLKNGHTQLHNGRRHYKERCDACIPALNHIKNQYQAPTRFSEDRVNV